MLDHLPRIRDVRPAYAILQTQCGELAIFDKEAIEKVVSSLPRTIGALTSSICYDPPPAPPPVELLDGFTIAQWSTYAKLKASIASRLCRENGLLKKQLAAPDRTQSGDLLDKLFEQDPWSTFDADAASKGCNSAPTTSACSTVELNAWSKWRPISEPAAIHPASVDEAVSAVESPTGDTDSDVVSPAAVDNEAASDLSLSLCFEANAPTMHTETAQAESLEAANFDTPSKSWDQKAALKGWARMQDEPAGDFLGRWMKERYLQKHGIPNFKNMDLAMAALGDIEINAVIKFTKTADYNLLDIPIYQVASAIDEAHETIGDMVVQDGGRNLHAKADSSSPAVPKVSLAAIRATQMLSSHNASSSKRNKSNQRSKPSALAKNSNGKHVPS